MAGHLLAVPPKVAGGVRHLSPDIKRAVRSALRNLCANPGAGEPLRGELQGLFKYRVRRFRIVYQVNRQERVVEIIAVGHRRDIYEEAAENLRPSSPA